MNQVDLPAEVNCCWKTFEYHVISFSRESINAVLFKLEGVVKERRLSSKVDEAQKV